jgi:hypothetical protein
MTIKLLFLDNNVIISQIRYIAQEEIGGSDLRLIEPFEVTTPTSAVLTEETDSMRVNNSFILVPWLIDYTTQNEFEIHSDKLITMAEPSPQLLSLYKAALQ